MIQYGISMMARWWHGSTVAVCRNRNGTPSIKAAGRHRSNILNLKNLSLIPLLKQDLGRIASTLFEMVQWWCNNDMR